MDALRIFLTACVTTGIFMILHALIRQTSLRGGASQLYLCSPIAIAIVWMLTLRFWPTYTSDLPAVAALTLCFSLAYVHWFVAMYRSLSVRILEELVAAGGAMTLSELDRVYSLRGMFAARLENLKENGWIALRDGKYACTAKGRRVARVIQGLRKLYGIPKAG